MRAATVVQVLQDFEAPPTIASRPPTSVANPHIDRSLGSKETHIGLQSHNHLRHWLPANVKLQQSILSHRVPYRHCVPSGYFVPNAMSAVEVFTTLRYINVHLLTYLLTKSAAEMYTISSHL